MGVAGDTFEGFGEWDLKLGREHIGVFDVAYWGEFVIFVQLEKIKIFVLHRLGPPSEYIKVEVTLLRLAPCTEYKSWRV